MARKSEGTAELFSVSDVEPRQGGRKVGRRRTGRHERALERAVRAADLEHVPVSAAAVSLARSLAWSLDTAEAKDNPYAVAQVAPQYLDALKVLGLVPAEGDDDDGFGELEGAT